MQGLQALLPEPTGTSYENTPRGMRTRGRRCGEALRELPLPPTNQEKETVHAIPMLFIENTKTPNTQCTVGEVFKAVLPGRVLSRHRAPLSHDVMVIPWCRECLLHEPLLARFRSVQKSVFMSHKGCRALSLPVPTRWFSTHRCISNIAHNKVVLRELFKDEDVIAQLQGGKFDKFDGIDGIVVSDAFWKSAKFVLKLIRPVTKAIAELEKDSASSAEVYKQFRGLLIMTRTMKPTRQVVMRN